jgi:hypothetical protein
MGCSKVLRLKIKITGKSFNCETKADQRMPRPMKGLIAKLEWWKREGTDS